MSTTLNDAKRVRVHHLTEAKARGEKITMLTAYDAPSARVFDAAGVDVLLVGDSVGTTVLGFDTTVFVTLDHMIMFAGAVVRGARRPLVVADLPFGSYQAGPQQALESAMRLMKEAGVHAVKFEGGRPVAASVRLIVDAGIPVIGHLGFTPQSEHALGGKRVQGRGEGAADEMIADALALQDAGACAIVLEMVPAPVAEAVTAALTVPTIGIGAGNVTDGQVLVWHDLVRFGGAGSFTPRFAKQYRETGEELQGAVAEYVAEVRSGAFPGPEHTFAS
ncbi:3-methyl-2-oxobutanoate hydroxymethyltransferase [Micrococcales bacterium 31B]|nr:3-methyl-2-oxobutanoate hydroxymethyltransferase [Micrococcales bacterium 31B]